MQFSNEWFKANVIDKYLGGGAEGGDSDVVAGVVAGVEGVGGVGEVVQFGAVGGEEQEGAARAPVDVA